jgi:hypothetical protein
MEKCYGCVKQSLVNVGIGSLTSGVVVLMLRDPFPFMNLRDHLRQILPEILPTNAAEAIKGTELIRLVRYRLGDEYSDATLRYHFSILSYDPTSPIAKVDQGQGYYLRTPRKAAASLAARTGLFEQDDHGYDALRQRYLRLVAIYERICLLRGTFPFVLNGRHGSPLRVDGDWDLPDMICADWEVEASSDEQPRFDETMINLRRHLGASEVGLCGVCLKMTLNHETATPEFFQALSATRWATQSELIIAEDITDAALVDALRSLGHQFGVGIMTLGVDLNRLDDLPDAESISHMSLGEFEAVQTHLRPQRISLAPQKQSLDWPALSSLRKKHIVVGELVKWLSECLDRRVPIR